MSAAPSEEAMRLARPVFGHAYRCDPLRNPLSLDCESDTCEIAKRAFAIDALVASRVEEERERCALVAGHFGNMQQRQDEEGIIAATAAYAVRDAIRIPPPPLPSKDSTPPRGEK